MEVSIELVRFERSKIKVLKIENWKLLLQDNSIFVLMALSLPAVFLQNDLIKKCSLLAHL